VSKKKEREKGKKERQWIGTCPSREGAERMDGKNSKYDEILGSGKRRRTEKNAT